MELWERGRLPADSFNFIAVSDTGPRTGSDFELPMTLEALLARVEPPSAVAADRDWAATTESLGIVFVKEYRDVVETFGRGYLEPGVVIWDPRSDMFEGDVSVELEVNGGSGPRPPAGEPPIPTFPRSGPSAATRRSRRFR